MGKTLTSHRFDSGQMEPTICVNLHDPGQGTVSVTVHPMDTVSVLTNHVMSGGSRVLCYKGAAITAGFTFQFLGIRNGDDIYVVKPKQPRRVSDKDYLRHNLKKKERLRRMALMMNSGLTISGARSLAREAARLMDVVANRCESQPPKGLAQGEEPLIGLLCPQTEATSIGAPSKGPSTDALPMFW